MVGHRPLEAGIGVRVPVPEPTVRCSCIRISRYTNVMLTPHFIILDGPMGSGKTTVAKLLFRRLPRTVLISWDDLKAFVSDYGQGTDDKVILMSMRRSLVKGSIENGLNVIMDAGFARGERMTPFIRLAKRNGYSLLIYRFIASYDVLLRRAVSRPKLFWEKKKICKARIVKHLHDYADRRYRGPITAEFDSYELSSEQITRRILRNLSL